MEDSVAANQRSVVQIVVKTLITHAFAIANFAQICHLTRLSGKHNSRLIRILLFSLIPGIALGQVIINTVLCILRMLRDLIDADIEKIEFDRHYASFNLYCWLGVFADVEHTGDDSSREESVRLSDSLQYDTTTKHKRPPWTWVRSGQIFACLLVTAQAIGSIVLWVRRRYCDCLINIDGRNMWMATGSAASTVQALPLLLFGNEWSLRPGTPFAPPVGEGKRILLETIAGALLLEITSLGMSTYYPFCLAKFLGFHDVDVPQGIVYAVILSLVLFTIAAVAGFVPFMSSAKLRRSRPVRNIWLLFLWITFTWVLVDAVGLLVVDIISLVKMKGSKEMWSDPIEEMIPVI